ncbi:MAG: hypothetical protein AAFY81_06925 [Pseudomonadota bacterium]
MTEIELRAAATTSTWRAFDGKPFDWAEKVTCIHLIAYHAAQMGREFPKLPSFKSAIGAKRALTKVGFASVSEAISSKFEPIAPAMMRTGDVMAVPGTEGLDALWIRVDRKKFFGFHENAEGATIIDVDVNPAIGAWRF